MQSLANSGDYFDAEFENIMGVSAEGGVETASSLALSPIALTHSQNGESGGDGGIGSSPSLFLSSARLEPLLALEGDTGTFDAYAPANAVHMVLQENAKLPTFNMTVDRSNAAPGLATRVRANSMNRGFGVTAPPPSSADGANVGAWFDDGPTHDLDEIVRLTRNDINLSEVFLGSDDRSSEALAYSNAASPAAANLGQTQAPSQLPVRRGISHAVPSNGASPPPFLANSGPDSNLKAHYSHGRSIPLPIPTRSESVAGAPGPDTMADAVATAAAIASQTIASPVAPPVTVRAGQQAGSKATPATEGVVIGTASTTLPSQVGAEAARSAIPLGQRQSGFPNNQKQSLQAHSANVAAAHSSSKASLNDSARKRSQYGFGSNHAVPSVPMPPMKRAAAPAAMMAKMAFSTTPGAAPLGGSAAKRPLPPTMSRPAEVQAADSLSQKRIFPGNINAGPAYERKKQRAKNARAQLNDAIEQLDLAISLAGTHSTQRAQRLSAHTMKPLSSPDNMLCPIRTYRNLSVKNMEDTSKKAGLAKKWERPSFVGTAAAVVKGLNAQCEALMRELVEMNRLCRELKAKNEAIPSDAPGDSSKGAATIKSVISSKDCVLEESVLVSEASNGEGFGPDGNVVEPSPKKVKVSEGEKSATSESMLPPMKDELSKVIREHKSLHEKILSCLDPTSLLKCHSVCRNWAESSCFVGDKPWTILSLRRFGGSNVMLWREDDSDDVDKKSAISPTQSKALRLYKRMDAAAVRPPCLYEGNVRMGHSKVPGVVGAWLSMVERSNGETLRSVRRMNTKDMTSPLTCGGFQTLPVIELRILIQNIGAANAFISVPDQALVVDASTRRRGEQMTEISWDDRLTKKIISPDGTTKTLSTAQPGRVIGSHVPELFRLGLFDYVVLVANFYAKGCSTANKFRRRANHIKVLVHADGTTRALAVPLNNREACDDDGSSSASCPSLDNHPIGEILVKK